MRLRYLLTSILMLAAVPVVTCPVFAQQSVRVAPAEILIVPAKVYTMEGYALGAAFAGHREKTEGSLVVGKAADVIMVDRNLFEIDPHAIGDTKVVTTIVGGKIVYEAGAK